MIALLAALSVGRAQDGGWVSLFDGQTLGDWRPTLFGGEGRVEVRDGEIRLGSGDPLTGITWAGGELPQENYEIALEAMLVAGNDFFCGLTFPVRGAACTLILGGWGGSVVGLSTIDGLDASENETTRDMRFERGRWYHVRVRVTETAIEAWLDGEPVVSARTAGRQIWIRPEVDLSRPLGVAAFRTRAALRDIRLRRMKEE